MNQQENWLIKVHFTWVAIAMVINSFVCAWARTHTDFSDKSSFKKHAGINQLQADMHGLKTTT